MLTLKEVAEKTKKWEEKDVEKKKKINTSSSAFSKIAVATTVAPSGGRLQLRNLVLNLLSPFSFLLSFTPLISIYLSLICS